MWQDNLKQSKYIAIREWLNKLLYIHRLGYYKTTKTGVSKSIYWLGIMFKMDDTEKDWYNMYI